MDKNSLGPKNVAKLFLTVKNIEILRVLNIFVTGYGSLVFDHSKIMFTFKQS